ncbi:outer membrane beta-barrel protein [Parasediminibacterium paludis]|uniref:Outer membrane beta-barrel protein n=1 Tax=Parasediminibacterium paludis TaxID=908966 RepID=A0ABV8Q165_9BACT
MKKLLLFLVSVAAITCSQAQIALFKKKNRTATSKTDSTQARTTVPKQTVQVITTPKVKKDWSKVVLTNRAADHFILQYGSDTWTNRPDSVRTKGFSRHFNIYVMLDKPLKTDPRFSVAYGLGLGSSNIFFDNVKVSLNATGSTLPFSDVSGTNHYKKFKLTTIYAEIPVELRYYSDPENPGKSWKFALGAKVGTLLKAYTKGKDLQTSNGASIYGPTAVIKESNKRYINGTRLAATARVGYGIFSLHGDYNVLGVVKDGFGPAMNLYSIGLTISGL